MVDKDTSPAPHATDANVPMSKDADKPQVLSVEGSVTPCESPAESRSTGLPSEPSPPNINEQSPPETVQSQVGEPPSKSSSSASADQSTPEPDGESATASTVKVVQPEWIATGLTYFKTVSASEEWEKLLQLWTAYEARLGFPDGSKKFNWLPSKNRPEEVSFWMTRGRSYDKMPIVDNAKQFGEAWKSWWRLLQPDWREWSWPPHPGEIEVEDKDWGKLHRGGCNAIFLVIITLSWWQVAATNDREKMDIKFAVADVARVVQSMLQVRKRPAADEAIKSPNKKRRRN